MYGLLYTFIHLMMLPPACNLSCTIQHAKYRSIDHLQQQTTAQSRSILAAPAKNSIIKQAFVMESVYFN
jgi:hypothetical protein